MHWELNDYELIYLICRNNEYAHEMLLMKYNDLVWHVINACLNSYHPRGVDREDLWQEGIIAINDAIFAYRTDMNAPFFSFVKVCLEWHIRSCIRKYNSMSARQFHHSLSIDMSVTEESGAYLSEVIAEDASKVSTFDIYETELRELLESDILTDFEKKVLSLKLLGYSYSEMSQWLAVTAKKIDNTIQKIKRVV